MASGSAAVRPEARELRLRPARLRDVRAIAHHYRAQPPGSRAFYHPFPFDRPRLAALLVAMVVVQRFNRRLLRGLPGAAVLLWVAVELPSGRLIGFATGRFRRETRAGVLVVRTGLLVEPAHRREGTGRSLKVELLREAGRLGARRAEALIRPENRASLEMNRALGFRFRPTRFHDRRSSASEFWLAEVDLDEVGPRPDVPEAGTNRDRVPVLEPTA